MKGDEFILVASTWAAPPTAKESACRSSISRAYYGAMHHCFEFFEDELALRCVRNSRRHEQLPFALGLIGDANVKAAGHKLSGLGTHRRGADYDLHLDKCNERKLAILAVEQARDIQSALRNFSATGNLRMAQQTVIAEIAPGKQLFGWTILRTV